MSAPVSTRYSDAFAAAPESVRTALLDRYGAASADALADADAIRARAAALPAAERVALTELLAFDPGFLEIAAGDSLPGGVVEAGLVFGDGPPGEQGSLVVPIEVRVALLDDATASSAPVAALLGAWDHDELLALAALHRVGADEGDMIGAAVAVAAALTDVERLDGVFDSLTGPAKRLVHWLCEIEEPVPLEKAIHMARRFTELAGDGGGAAERVLLRFGIAQEIQVDGDDLLVVPHDVREALRPIIETSLSERCRACYERLRDGAIPAFRDIFPQGSAGNPLVAARQRVVRASLVGADSQDRLDRLLLVFRTLSDTAGVGDLASLHLDVATPERFAQECLRSWLGSLDDDFTRVLIEPFGGDCVELADWILDPAASGEFSPDAQEWSAFLYDLRANLVFTLGVLGPGLWHSVASLVDWLAAVYRRLLWHAGGFHGLGDDAPGHAFPVAGVEVTAEEEARLYEALVILLVDLLEPIGAVRLDETGTLFMTNPEALRVFRDGDPGFETVWTDTESYVGDDIDLWMPIPTSWGARVSGVANMHWIDDATIELGGDAHLLDLLRLARWANPLFVGNSTHFVFDAESVQRGADVEDAEAFMVWLVTRIGDEIPGAVRTLFPVSVSAADGDEPIVEAMGVTRHLIDELDQWGESVPLDIMEAVRSYGDAAAGVVVDALAAVVEAGDSERPELRHLTVLAGELGAREAVPLLLRVLAQTTFEPAEGAASVALARIGDAAFEGLVGLLNDPRTDVDKRLASAGSLAAMAVLHPTVCDAVVSALTQVAVAVEDLPEDVPTLVGLLVSETGHPRAESFVRALRDQGIWLDDVMPFDEALWTCGISPAIWGPPIAAAPMAYLYPPRAEAERLRDEEGTVTPPIRRKPR